MTTPKKLNINLKLLFYIVLVLALALAAFRIYMIEAYYEEEMYTFAHGTVLPYIFNYTVFVIVVIIFGLFAFIDKNSLPGDIGKTSPFTVAFSAATGLFALIGGLYAISQIMIRDPNEILMEQLGMQTAQDTRLTTFVQIQCILSLAVFAYFMLTAFSVNKYSRVKSVLGILTIVWHVVFLLVIYFDMSKPINAPIKMMYQFAVLVSMIYMVYEVRFMLGMGRPRMYAAVSLVAIIIMTSAAIPMTLCAFTGAFTVILSNLLYSLQLIGMLGYIICRSITYLNQKPKAVPAAEAQGE